MFPFEIMAEARISPRFNLFPLLKTCNKQSVVPIKKKRINTCIDTKSTCQNELKRGESLKRNSDVTKLQAIAPHLYFTDIGTPLNHQRALKTNPRVPTTHNQHVIKDSICCLGAVCDDKKVDYDIV